MPDFTKGKWSIRTSLCNEIYQDIDHYLIVPNYFSYGKDLYIAAVPDRVNARLIASAPEMYELLRDTWERDFSTFAHSLNRERSERFYRIKALLDLIDAKGGNQNA